MTIAVYRIVNSKTNACYIGSTYKLELRLKTHALNLEKGTHINIKLQNDFYLYGKDVFDVEILEEYDFKPDRNYLYEREDYFIQLYKSKETGYNIADAKFGDVLSHHPNKEDIIKRREASRKVWLSTLTEEQKKQRLENQYLGEKNSNWNPNLKHNCQNCGKPVSYSSMVGKGYCNSCRDRSGKNNPFFGKKHSPETIAKLKAVCGRSGKDNPNSKKVYAEGIIYDSASECAKAHNMKAVGTVTNRCRSKNFPNWYFL